MWRFNFVENVTGKLIQYGLRGEIPYGIILLFVFIY